MASRFSKEEQREIRQLLGMPSDAVKGIRTKPHRVSVAEVRRTLNLPEMPYEEFLSNQCWLAGGIILRWLCGELNDQQGRPVGDFDFYFSSLEALKQTAEIMFASKYEFCTSLALPRSFWDVMFDRKRPKRAEEATVFHEDNGFSRISRKLSDNLTLVGVELCSPAGDTIQLATFLTKPVHKYLSPYDVIADFDLSICQFAMDDRYLYAGQSAWSDLLAKRFHVVLLRDPYVIPWRIQKYIRRGFLPYPATVIKAFYNYFLRRV